MCFTVRKGSQKGFLEGGLQKVRRTTPHRHAFYHGHFRHNSIQKKDHGD